VLLTMVYQTIMRWRNDGRCHRWVVVRDVITYSLANQQQLAEMLGFIQILLLSTELPCVRSRQPILVTLGLMVYCSCSKNLTMLQKYLFLLLFDMFCPPTFIPLFWYSSLQFNIKQNISYNSTFRNKILKWRPDNICQYILLCKFIIWIEYI
jgi:hypothetical protein